MLQDNSQIIQAFPMRANTYVGVANSYTGPCEIIHAGEDGTLTLNYGTLGSVVVDVLAGQDLAIDSHIEAVTSTGIVWIS